MSVSRYRVLLVSSAGGVFRDLLALEPWWSRHDPVWAAVRAADTESVLDGGAVHWLRERSASRPLGVLAATIEATRVLRAEDPDVVVSAGTGVAVAFFLMARVLRIPALWLTTLNLVATPGKADRICSRLASAILLQQSSMLAAHPRGVVLGELY